MADSGVGESMVDLVNWMLLVWQEEIGNISC